MYPKNDGSWSFAIAMVADTLGALHHTPSPRLSSPWQYPPQVCSYSSCSLLLVLRAFSEAVRASHREHSNRGDKALPPTFNYSKRQELMPNAPSLSVYLQWRPQLCTLVLAFPPSLPQSPHSVTAISWDRSPNKSLHIVLDWDSAFRRTQTTTEMSHPSWWQTKKCWQKLQCTFPLMP